VGRSLETALGWNWPLLQFFPGAPTGIGPPSPARNWNWWLLQFSPV
jgi:hypothetical protein